MLGRIKNIGLSWKVQLAPAFLILILIGVGVYALQALRSNQAAVDALVSGPVRQSELANDLTTAAWTAHAKLYRLTATAANEKDEKKIEAMAKEASAAAGKIAEAVQAIEDARGDINPEAFAKLKAAVAGYLKKSKNAIEMADGDAGSALMFIKGAEQSFAVIEKLTDDLLTHSSDSKDREIARAGLRLDQQQYTLTSILLVVAFAGIVVSFLIGRSISRPVVAMSRAMRELAAGNFEVQLPGLQRRDEFGQMAHAVQEFKVQAVAKAERETAEREQKNRELAAGRRAELHELAENFETTVGNIIENVGAASDELENSAVVLTESSAATQELSTVVATASEETSANVQSVAAATEEMAGSINEIGRQVGEFQPDRQRGRGSGAKDRRPHRGIVACRKPHRRCHPVDHHDRGADQSAGAECHHRSRARRRRRPWLCGGGAGGQGARRADRQGHQRDQRADRRHAGGDCGFGAGHQGDQRHDRPRLRDRSSDRGRDRGTGDGDPGNRPQRAAGGCRLNAGGNQHRRRQPRRRRHRFGIFPGAFFRANAFEREQAPESRGG